MRRALILILLPLAVSCRPPAIPAEPSAREYAVYGSWMEQVSLNTPPGIRFAVDAETMMPRQNEVQFEECLPPRMEEAFESAPSAHLVSSSGNDWLTLNDGRSTQLYQHAQEPAGGQPTEMFRLSRVAFTRSGFEAYLWVEHRSCGLDGRAGCSGNSGALLHARRSGGSWSFEDTTCHTIAFPG